VKSQRGWGVERHFINGRGKLWGFPFKGFGAFPGGTASTKIGHSAGISNRIQLLLK